MRDAGSVSASRLDEPGVLQLAIGASDGSWREREIGGQLTDGRQTNIGRQLATKNERRYLASHLFVRRQWRRRIDNDDHGPAHRYTRDGTHSHPTKMPSSPIVAIGPTGDDEAIRQLSAIHPAQSRMTAARRVAVSAASTSAVETGCGRPTTVVIPSQAISPTATTSANRVMLKRTTRTGAARATDARSRMLGDRGM